MAEIEIEMESALQREAGPSGEKLLSKTEEKADAKTYCKLERPADDIYSEAVFVNPPLKEQPVEPNKPTKRRHRPTALLALCIVLGLVCLCEFVIIFILIGKTPPTSVCQGQAIRASSRLQAVGLPYKPCTLAPDRSTIKSPDSHRCPDNWVFHQNSCFFISKERKSWSGSQAVCRGEAGDLAVTSDSSIQTFLMNFTVVPHWVGLKYQTNRWQWLDNSIEDKSQWAAGDSTAGMCGTLSQDSNHLEAYNCEETAHFICRKRAS